MPRNRWQRLLDAIRRVTEPVDPRDDPPPSPPGEPRRPWYRAITLSLSAFVMSLAVTLIGAFSALKGPEIVIRAPKQVILYRDGTGAGAVLGAILPVEMINTASDYGDVLLEARIRPGGDAPSFGYQGVARTVFTEKSQEAAERCELGARCVALPGLLTIENGESLLDIPGGAARAVELTFPIAQWNCETSDARCGRYGGFDQAVAAIGGKPLEIRAKLALHSDGDRDIVCKAGKIEAEYLRKVGWVSLACDHAEVRGEPFF